MDILLDLFVDNLLPIFLVAGAGYVVGGALDLNARALALVTFNIFSPCLVFNLITESQLDGGAMLRMAGLATAVLVILGALAWLVGGALGLPRSMRAALVLAAMLPNAGNYGLPLNQLAFGDTALAHAGIYFIASSVLLYTAGVLVASLGKADLRTALLGLLKVPAIYAVLLALIVVDRGWFVPQTIERTVTLVGDAAIPTFLVVLGLQLRRAHAVRPSPALAAASALKLVVSPLLAIGLVALLSLEGPARQAGVIEAAMPTAVATTVLAEAYDVEPGFVTAAVFLTTILSPLTVTPLLAWLGA